MWIWVQKLLWEMAALWSIVFFSFEASDGRTKEGWDCVATEGSNTLDIILMTNIRLLT